MNTPISSIIYFIIAAMFGALGQYLYKAGAESSNGLLLSYLTNIKLIGGVFCYVTVMLLFVAAFKKGGSLTVLYPNLCIYIYMGSCDWIISLWYPNKNN